MGRFLDYGEKEGKNEKRRHLSSFTVRGHLLRYYMGYMDGWNMEIGNRLACSEVAL